MLLGAEKGKLRLGWPGSLCSDPEKQDCQGEACTQPGLGKGCQGWEDRDILYPGVMLWGHSLLSIKQTLVVLGSKVAREGQASRKR